MSCQPRRRVQTDPEHGVREERAPHAAGAPPRHVRINHRRSHIGMTEQFLHRADVTAGLQQMRRERMPQRMAADALACAMSPSPEIVVETQQIRLFLESWR